MSIMSLSNEIPGAVGGVNKAYEMNGYEHLQASGNIYDNLDEAPRPPSMTWRPTLPLKPTKSIDDDGYLKVSNE